MLDTKIPDFTLPATGGQQFSLAAQAGKVVIIYFYPKDSTPGCTTEAQQFRDLYDRFVAVDAVILGISRDSVKSHDKFCRKFGLSIVLASDESGQTCEAYGVWVEKSMYGKKYMGIVRSAFLIQEGVVLHAWYKISPADTPANLLKALKK